MVAAAVTAAAIALSAGEAHAQGFGVYEQGTCVMGRAGAAVAEPCDDGSAIFFNPAALPSGEEWRVTFGATAIVADGEFEADAGGSTDLDSDIAVVPHAYVTRGLGERWSAGLGVFAPYGLQTKWPLDFEGRFVGFDNRLQSIYVQPTVSFRSEDGRFAVGGGPTLVVSSVELNRRLDLAAFPVPAMPEAGVPAGATFGEIGLVPPGTDFGTAALESGRETGYGANLGVRARVTERVSLGLRYMTGVEIEYDDGEAEFRQIETGITLPADNPLGAPAGTPIDGFLQGAFAANGPLGDQGVSTVIEMPAQLVAGVAVDATDRLTLHGDWQWTEWSSFDRVVLEFSNPATPTEVLVENYDDTNGIRLGAAWAFEDGYKGRFGYFWNEEASPTRAVTPLLPEASRNQGMIGATLPLTETFTLDLAYQVLFQEDRRGRSVPVPPGADAETFTNGEFSFGSHLFGATVRLRF